MLNHEEIYKDLFEIKYKIHIVKNGRNTFISDKFKYFTLSDIHKAVLPLFYEKNIFYFPTNDIINNEIMIIYLHFIKDGKHLTLNYSMPLSKIQRNITQDGGSTSTYGERYALQMLFSLSDDRDDPDYLTGKNENDNNKTAKPTKTELDKLNTAFENFGLTERADKLNFIKSNVGKVSSADLNKNDIQELLRLLKWIIGKRDI